MKKKGYIYLKILFNYLIAIGIVALLVFALPPFIGFAWPFLVGCIVALIANPIVRFLDKKLKLLRKHGAAIVIVLTIAIIIGLIYLILYFLINQGTEFASNFPKLYEDISKSIQNTADEIQTRFSFLPGWFRDVLDNLLVNGGKIFDSIIADITKRSNFSIADAGSVVKSIAEAILMTIFTILFSYFLTSEHDKIAKVYREKVPEGLKNGISVIKSSITTAFGGYFKAQFKIMLCVFVIMAIGLVCLGVEYAVLVAFVIAFVDFLPFFGAGAIIWPWCLYDVIAGNYLRAIILFAIYLVCQGVRQFLQPKLVADSIGMNPLLTLIFMFVGYRFGGILGMIIGIPVGMIVVSFYEKGVFDYLIRGAKIIIGDLNKWRKY